MRGPAACGWGSSTARPRSGNGQPGLVAQLDGITVTVFAFDVVGDRIRRIWVVRNLEKTSALDDGLTSSLRGARIVPITAQLGHGERGDPAPIEEPR
jgi:hypothetical protein